MADKKQHVQSRSGKKGGEQGMQTHSQQQAFNVNPMAAAAAGAIVGAAAGAVAGAVLSNDKTRKQVGDAFQTMRDRAMNTVQQVSDSTKELRKNAPKNLEEAKHMGQKKMEEMKEKEKAENK